MSLPLIDSHCHLDAPEFDADRERVLADATAAGVAGLVIPAYVAARWPTLLDFCATLRTGQPRCFPALGLHPVHLAAHADAEVQELEATLRKHPEVVAVGEIGLDRFLPALITPEAWARQLALFEAQLVLARERGLPVILHARRCHAQILASLKRTGHREGGILHAFSGSVEEARQYVAQGLHLGLGGPLTWPQSARLRAVASALPLSALVIETDAPDLVTYPHSSHHGDGRPRQPGERVRNSPAWLPDVLDTFATLRPEPRAQLAAAFWDNAVRALRLPLPAFSDHPTAS